MMRFKRTAVLTCAAALVALAGPAMAAQPTVVEVNGVSTIGFRSYSGASGSVGISIAGVNMGCTGATASGAIHRGPISSDVIADIQGTSWTSCVGPLGMTLTLTQNPGDWSVQGLNGASSALGDTIGGRVDAFSLHATLSGAPCQFDIIGAADTSFLESVSRGGGVFGQDLVIAESSGNLRVSSMLGGCLGLFTPGDQVDLAATFNINVAGASSTRPINVLP